ncbi:MAG: AAA family ATPase [Thermotogae bacterium]|nr:AAA family ATPase [Thermotogota bacterium]
MKSLPIGVDDFEELVKNGYYLVDKSLLIKDIIDLPGKIKLITRPRRFGKTLNMTMMRSFFTVEKKENLFEDLEIWNERGIVKDYHHNYPVIFVTFKEIKDVTWKDALDHLKTWISNLVENYAKVIKTRKFQRWAEKITERQAPTSEYMDSLRNLTQVLHEETGKRTILLIDEYDVPIEAAYTYRHKDPDYYDNMVAFMRNMLTAALKGNEHLEFGILTGVYRVAKESIFSGLNNLSIYTVFETEMSERFGFTEEEITKILRYYGLGGEDRKVVDEWYGGYRVGKYGPLYNPWGVIYYIKERLYGKKPPQEAAQPFWINTSSNDIIKEQIKKSPEVRKHLNLLLEGKEVKRRVDPWLSLRELEEVKHGVWTLFVAGGYLVARYIQEDVYALKVPNKEVLKFFRNVVSVWLENTANFPANDLYNSLIEMLKEGRMEEFGRYLEGFIRSSLSYYDLGFEESERVYKVFLLGMLSIAINGYEVESELESGYGRLDVVIYPKERKYGNYAAIFEVKRADSEEKLEELVKQALEQIKERKYYTKMKSKGLGIIAFGIAFSGKKALIKVEKM